MDEEPIRINKPEKVLKILQYTMQGFSDDKVGKKLGMSAPAVYQMRERFEEVLYPRLLKFVEEVKRTKYYVHNFSSSENQKHAQSARERLLAQGYPIASGEKNPPGYIRVNGVWEAKPDKAQVELVKRAFEIFYNGGTMRQVSEETGYSYDTVTHMLHNRIYIGIRKYRGKEYYFPNLVIIDKKMWEACQKVRRPPNLKFGFIRRGEETLKDPKKSPKIVEAVDLRLQQKSSSEIAEKTGLTKRVVLSILKDPTYANKIEIEGKPSYEWPDAGVEPIVPFEKWLEAHKIFINHSPGEVSGEAKKKRMMKRLDDMLAYIATKEPEGVRHSELIKRMQLSRDTISKYLRISKGQGYIEKINGKWHIKSD